MDQYQENAEVELSEGDKVAFDNWCHPVVHHCRECSTYSANRWQTFIAHINRTHSLPLKNYIEKYGEVKMPMHKCKICGKDHRHDWDSLVMHFNNKAHCDKINLQGYFLKHIKDTLPKTFWEKAPTILSQPESQTQTRTKGRRIKVGQFSVPITPMEKWCSQESSTCKICKIYVAPRGILLTHVRATHKISRHEYEAKFGTMKAPAKHICKICETPVKHDRPSLEHHFERSDYHEPSISLARYFKCYIDSSCPEYLTIKVQDTNKKSDGIEFRENGNKIENTQHSVTTSKNMEKDYSQWMFKCHWSCTLCDYSTKKVQSMSTHLRKVHKTNIKSLKKDCQADLLTRH